MILKKLRHANEYNQNQVANYLGISLKQYDKIENNKKCLNLTLLNKICSLYGCSEEYILGLSNDYNPPKISINSNDVNLKLISKLNTINNNLKLLRQLEAE